MTFSSIFLKNHLFKKMIILNILIIRGFRRSFAVSGQVPIKDTSNPIQTISDFNKQNHDTQVFQRGQHGRSGGINKHKLRFSKEIDHKSQFEKRVYSHDGDRPQYDMRHYVFSAAVEVKP